MSKTMGAKASEVLRDKRGAVQKRTSQPRTVFVVKRVDASTNALVLGTWCFVLGALYLVLGASW